MRCLIEYDRLEASRAKLLNYKEHRDECESTDIPAHADFVLRPEDAYVINTHAKEVSNDHYQE